MSWKPEIISSTWRSMHRTERRCNCAVTCTNQMEREQNGKPGVMEEPTQTLSPEKSDSSLTVLVRQCEENSASPPSPISPLVPSPKKRAKAVVTFYPRLMQQHSAKRCGPSHPFHSQRPLWSPRSQYSGNDNLQLHSAEGSWKANSNLLYHSVWKTDPHHQHQHRQQYL